MKNKDKYIYGINKFLAGEPTFKNVFRDPMFSCRPDGTINTSVDGMVQELDYIERAYNDFLTNIDNGTFDYTYKISYPNGITISIEQMESNILAWYQMLDSIMCGET